MIGIFFSNWDYNLSEIIIATLAFKATLIIVDGIIAAIFEN